MEINTQGTNFSTNAQPYGTRTATVEVEGQGAEVTQAPAPNNSVGNEKQDARDEVKKEVDSLNKWLGTKNTHLRFQMHDRLKEYYVQIVDDRTNEVVREVPSKKIMDLAANMYELAGIIVDEKR
ncbi:MAG: flagellar protein FlaG [Clostridia bacterium]